MLPAQKARAEATLAQAEVELNKTTVRAGVDGTVEKFTLRKGDIVNPMMRSAGLLIPAEAGRVALVALEADDDHPDGGDDGVGPDLDGSGPDRRKAGRSEP